MHSYLLVGLLAAETLLLGYLWNLEYSGHGEPQATFVVIAHLWWCCALLTLLVKKTACCSIPADQEIANAVTLICVGTAITITLTILGIDCHRGLWFPNAPLYALSLIYTVFTCSLLLVYHCCWKKPVAPVVLEEELL
jgi:hypothetical protein